MDIDLLDQYIDLVLSYFANPHEEYLEQVEIIGKESVTNGADPEDLDEMHEEAQNGLIKKQSDITLKEANEKLSVLLMELFIAYGLASRMQIHQGKLWMN